MTTILIPLVILGLCYIIRLYTKCFKITVSGKQITVKKGMSEKYSFTVSEIIRVDKETEKK